MQTGGTLLTLGVFLMTCRADLAVTSPVASVSATTEPVAVTTAASAAETEAGAAGTGSAVTVSCQDELHCHCALGNNSVAVQCRYGDQNVLLRWNILATRPPAETRFEIDIQTRGTVKVLPSFLDLRLKSTGDGRPAVMFIIRDASLLDALYASNETFSTEWHLDRVRLRSLNGEQLSPAPHPLLLTARDGEIGQLRLPQLSPGTRLTLDNCTVTEVTGIPELAPTPLPPERTADRPEVIVRKCNLRRLRTAAFSLRDAAGQNPPSLLFTGCVIDEMERAAITVRSTSCQLTFDGNRVNLLQREAFSVVGGTLRLTNNTLLVPHAAALRGFCGQLSFVDNDVHVAPVFGALHFDPCVRYSVQGNVFQCPCGSVGWLGMFEQRQRTSAVEVFYERLFKGSYCRTAAGKMPMVEFARQVDCSGKEERFTMVMAVAALAAAVTLLALPLALCCCCRRRRHRGKLHRPRLRRTRNLYSSDISAPIPKSGVAAPVGRPATAPSSASLSALSSSEAARHPGNYVTLESEDDDGLYATIIYKKRRAPDPPPGSTPGPRRAAPPGVLNRCVSEGGIRLPVYGSLQALPARQQPAAGVERLARPAGYRRPDTAPLGIAEEQENPYLVPDGTASVYTEVPTVLYDEVLPTAAVHQGGHPHWDAPHPGKTSKDSGIGDDFCPEAATQEAAVAAGGGVYSPAVRPRVLS